MFTIENMREPYVPCPECKKQLCTVCKEPKHLAPNCYESKVQA